MSDTLVLHELPPSPNNMKVRLGLGYKGLTYERKLLDFDEFPGDRSAVVAASGQPLTPVLVHGDRSIFDSGSILRYLEANFRDTPPLFSTDYQAMKEIESWEWMARTQLATPTAIVFDQVFASDKSSEQLARALKMMRELTGYIDDRLTETGFLVGDHMTAADITAIPHIALTMLSKSESTGPVITFFADNLQLGDDRSNVRAWAEKVLTHDAHNPY